MPYTNTGRSDGAIAIVGMACRLPGAPVLELGREALEDAGIVPASLAGTATGVFVGLTNDDFPARVRDVPVTGYTAVGANRGVTANRLSYFLGLRGPSFTVDSAQSSSLVAVHVAAESLLRGECVTAIAAGVNLILNSDTTEQMRRMGALSPDGRCYTFDARANGDRVYAVIQGSAVNNDGGGPNLTSPSRDAQEALLRLAYGRAGVDPAAVELPGKDHALTADSVTASRPHLPPPLRQKPPPRSDGMFHSPVVIARTVAANSLAGLTCRRYNGLHGVLASRRASESRSVAGSASRWISARRANSVMTPTTLRFVVAPSWQACMWCRSWSTNSTGIW